MSNSPGVTSLGGSCSYHHDVYKDTFDPNDCCKEQADYLAKHSEVTTLAALFVSHTVQRKVWSRNILKEAGLFFTRSAEILDDEIKQEQKRTEKAEVLASTAKKDKATIETDSFHTTNRYDLTKVSFCESKPALKASVESLYSGFVTESTSASTMPVEEIPEPSKPTLTEFMHQLVLNLINNGLDEMYATRKTEVIYDEAHLCLMRSIQMIVETMWNPIIDDFKELLVTMVDNVRCTALQRHRMKLRAMDKVPIKAQRLRNNYRGFSSEENKPPTRKEILGTMKERKWTFNRYPKDAFGVYISSENESNTNVSSEVLEYDFSANSCSGIELPTLRSSINNTSRRLIADLPVPILSNSTRAQQIVLTLPNSSVETTNRTNKISISFE